MLTRNARQRYFEIAKLAAHSAGETIRLALAEPLQIDIKSDDSLVTRIDMSCEAVLRELLERHSPECSVLGEEEGLSGGNRPLDAVGGAQSEARWYLDPVDGTTNMAHGFPWFCVSIGLIVDGQAEVGVVYNPVTNHFFEAMRGEGARLNGRPIAVSKTEHLGDALLATGFAPGRHQEGRVDNRVVFAEVLRRCHAIRRPGSAALDLASVAAGWFDGYWESGLHPWDSAAGWLLVEEAGGRVSKIDGSPFDPHVPRVLATNGLLHEELGAILRAAMAPFEESAP
ncbi:MAG: inositol monophosphatase [Deltaproteobacteria bacterium CG_4_9_14_3_um_filter_63_12]|nr:MAG: inositol monophosphatase [Deltaproteobacteria bacterium CG_4_9_14_3_um_filter_63_12]